MCTYEKSIRPTSAKGRLMRKSPHHQGKNCSWLEVESTTPHGRRWGRSLDRVVSWQDTTTAKVTVSKGSQHLKKQERYIDSFDPQSAFIRTETPPFLSHARVDAVPMNRREQKGRDHCDTKDVKGTHSSTVEQKAQAGLRCSPLNQEGFYGARARASVPWPNPANEAPSNGGVAGCVENPEEQYWENTFS